jgi:hypothetical protein
MNTIKLIRIAICLITSTLIAGCVSRYALLENPDTRQQQYCTNKGWGWIGAPMAISDHNECLEKLEKQGYKKISDQPLSQ